MLLIISTFFGLCWLVQYRSFKKQDEAILQAAPSAKIIDLQQRIAVKAKALHSQKNKFHTQINLKKAK